MRSIDRADRDPSRAPISERDKDVLNPVELVSGDLYRIFITDIRQIIGLADRLTGS